MNNNKNNVFVECFAVFKESSPLSFYLHLLSIPKKVPFWLVEDNRREEVWFPAIFLKFELNEKVKRPELFRSRSPPLSVRLSWPLRFRGAGVHSH